MSVSVWKYRGGFFLVGLCVCVCVLFSQWGMCCVDSLPVCFFLGVVVAVSS